MAAITGRDTFPISLIARRIACNDLGTSSGSKSRRSFKSAPEVTILQKLRKSLVKVTFWVAHEEFARK